MQSMLYPHYPNKNRIFCSTHQICIYSALHTKDPCKLCTPTLHGEMKLFNFAWCTVQFAWQKNFTIIHVFLCSWTFFDEVKHVTLLFGKTNQVLVTHFSAWVKTIRQARRSLQCQSLQRPHLLWLLDCGSMTASSVGKTFGNRQVAEQKEKDGTCSLFLLQMFHLLLMCT